MYNCSSNKLLCLILSVSVYVNVLKAQIIAGETNTLVEFATQSKDAFVDFIAEQSSKHQATVDLIVKDSKAFFYSFSLKPQTLREAIIHTNSTAVKSFLAPVGKDKTLTAKEYKELVRLAQDIAYVRRYALCGLFKSPRDMGVLLSYLTAIGVCVTGIRMFSEYIDAYTKKTLIIDAAYGATKRAYSIPKDAKFKRKLLSSAQAGAKFLGIVGIACCFPGMVKAWRLEYGHRKLKEAREIEAMLIDLVETETYSY